MPLFEYICKKCNTKFEKIVFSIDKEKVQCPKCKSEDVQKQISLFSSGGNSEGCSDVSCGSNKSGGCCCGGHCHHH